MLRTLCIELNILNDTSSQIKLRKNLCSNVNVVLYNLIAFRSLKKTLENTHIHTQNPVTMELPAQFLAIHFVANGIRLYMLTS